MKTFDADPRSLLIPLCEYKHPSSGGPYFKALYTPQLMSVLSVYCNPEHVIVDAQVLIKLYELKSVRAKMSSR